MKAVQFAEFGGPEVLKTVEVDVPEPAAGQIRIKVKATGVNPIDWKLRKGLMPARVQLPAGTGSEASGVVDAVGEGVEGVSVGDEVMGLVVARAATAEYAILHHWAQKPDAMSFTQAAALPLAAETAGRIIGVAGIEPGWTVLIDGASGSAGLTTTQFLVARGVTVIGTASEANQGLLAEVGAVPVTYGDGLAERVAKVASQGVGAVLDFAGKDIPQLIDIAGDADRVVGVADLKRTAELGARTTINSEEAGSFESIAEAADLFEAGKLAIRVGAVYPFDRVGDAQVDNEQGNSAGKVVVEI